MNRDQRLANWLEGELDADEQKELLRELSSDETFARKAAAQLQMKRLLASQAVDEKEFTRELLLRIQLIDEATSSNPYDGLPRPSNTTAAPTALEGHRTRPLFSVLERLQRRRRWQRVGLAVTGFAAAAAIVLLLLFPRTATPTLRVLAAEGVQSLDVRALEEGRQVAIEGGILELELGSETRLVLEAPAEFAVESVHVVRLVSGRCYAEMEKGTSGLLIKTPSGEVLDLGTRFGVEVMPSSGTSVHVFEGEVELAVAQNRSVLHEGEGIRWTENNELKQISVEAERFVSRLPGSDGQHKKWLHWPLDERTGEATAPRGDGFPSDLEPAKLHGAQWIERNGSGALEFDGVDDWVETTFSGIGADADRTVAAWVKLAPDFGEANGQAIVGWGDFFVADPNRRMGRVWELGVGDIDQRADLFGRLKVAVGGPMTVGHEDLRDERWHHVAAVYLSDAAPNGRGIVLLYVDARLQQRWFGRSAIKVNTEIETRRSEPVQFGRQVMRGGRKREFFKGSIDDVFIIDQALSGKEIRELMQTNKVPH